MSTKDPESPETRAQLLAILVAGLTSTGRYPGGEAVREFVVSDANELLKQIEDSLAQ